MATRSHIVVKINEEDKGKVMRFNTNIFEWLKEKKILDKEYKDIVLDGNYIKIYHHFDSHKNRLGRELLETYNSYDKALNLCLGGDCSSIVGCYTPYYAIYDDDFEITRPKLSNEIPSLEEDYLYLFKDEKWFVKGKNDEDFKELTNEYDG